MDANQRLPLSGREHHNGGSLPTGYSLRADGDAGLADLVTPPGPDTFLTKTYGRGHQVFGTPDPARFRALGGWDELNRLLADQRLDSSQLRLVRRGELVPEDTYTVTEITRFQQTWQRVLPAALAQQLRTGATLRLRDVDQLSPPVRALAAALEHDLREEVGVNLYASCTEVPGTTTHHDPHDVLVLQLAGRKRWQIFGAHHPRPLQGDAHATSRESAQPPPDEPAADILLEAGQVLYLPRGWWHAVNASHDTSLHLTFRIARATGLDLLTWLTGTLRTEDLLRQDLPRPADRAARQEYVARLRRLVLERFEDPALLDRMAADRDAARRPDAAFALPYAAWPEDGPPTDLPGDTRAQLRVRRAVLEDTGETVLLRAGGTEQRCPPGSAPVLERLMTGRPATVTELTALAEAAAGRDQVRSLLLELARAGLLALEGH